MKANRIAQKRLQFFAADSAALFDLESRIGESVQLTMHRADVVEISRSEAALLAIFFKEASEAKAKNE